MVPGYCGTEHRQRVSVTLQRVPDRWDRAMHSNGTHGTGRLQAATDEGAGRRFALRVAIVADVRLYREGLAELIRGDDIEVVAQVRSRDASAIDLGAGSERAPDVVLWDVAGQGGIDGLDAFVAAAGNVRVLVLAVDELEAEVIRLAEAGMAGYVTRDADVPALVDAIRNVAAGEFPCTPRVAGTLLRRVGTLARRERVSSSAVLTPRELEVVRLAGRGLTNKEIAAELTVELSTVKNHLHNALEKLGVHRRTEAVARVGATRD
jgi:two-component system, NarL family, nitrate/nitrite response regulator NarL